MIESGEFPVIVTTIEGKLHLWFGDADAPVLELEPIDLASLD